MVLTSQNTPMPISPARTSAFDILLRVERASAYASELLHATRYANLSPADHRLATELVMGVLRWRSVLDEQIAAKSAQPLGKLDLEVLTALRLAAYQMMFLSRVPARAAVHESVELVKRAGKKSAAPFVNAILRKLGSAKAPTLLQGAGTAEVAAALAHPLWLVERWAREFGPDRARQVWDYDQKVADTVIRLHAPEAESELQNEGIRLSPGRLLSAARLVESGDITATRAFRAGHIAIQDEASQLVALLVGTGRQILDCCAAPGGKTRVLAEENPAAEITAVELHPHRARLLRKLVPVANLQVVTGDISTLPCGEAFDRVLADVPCSGTGTLARNPEIKWRLRPEDLADLQQRQVAILKSAMRHTTPGGRIVYSTCSLEGEENEAVVEMVLAEPADFRLLDVGDELRRLQREGRLVWRDLNSLVQGPFLRTIPGIHPCNGFFAAMLERKIERRPVFTEP
jgi:16S rRNA (cytosine967-C5)-methyltransferase